MKRTEIPAVKGFVDLENDTFDLQTVSYVRLTPPPAGKVGGQVPCILRTAAADKLILDVVRQVMTGKDSMWDKRVNDAVQRLEKAGVKL